MPPSHQPRPCAPQTFPDVPAGLGTSPSPGGGRFFGAAGPAVQTGSLQVSVSSFAAGARLPEHGHDSTYLSLVLSGSYLERVGRRAVRCTPSTLRLHPAGEEHADDFGAHGGVCLNVEFSAAWSDSVREVTRGLSGVALTAVAGWPGLRMALITLRGLRAHDSPTAALSLEVLAAELLARCGRQASVERAVARSEALRRVVEMLEGAQGRLPSLAVLAAEAQLHPTHLARAFRRHTGTTIGGYVRRWRLERAESLLAAPAGGTVSRIAADAGFADHAHLTRSLKHAEAVTPSEFRRVARLVARR